MDLTPLEAKRLSRISPSACKEIARLNEKADELWDPGSHKDSLRAAAKWLNLSAQASEIYRKEVLFRKF